MEPIKHIHHISAIVGDPQETYDFYTRILNLQLIKQTVNYDDPHTYHLYFSNYKVNQDMVLTFFNWPNQYRGQVGFGQVGRLAFRIPKDRLDEWEKHLTNHHVTTRRSQLFNQPTLEFEDVHGLTLALVESEETADSKDIVGFHGVTMLSSRPALTEELLRDDLKLEKVRETETNVQYQTVGDVHHQVIVEHQDIPEQRVKWGVGVFHHIAWSVEDDDVQTAWRNHLIQKGFKPTEVKERFYFHAVYMKEKGELIFELATEGPGFTIDESVDELGMHLQLPPFYEDRRYEIETFLAPLKLND